MLPDMGKGLLGKRLGERGDIFRNINVPELVAAAGGLATDPQGILTGAGDLAAKGVREARQLAAGIGAENAKKVYASLWGGLGKRAFKLNEDELKFMVNDGMKFLDEKVMKGDPFAIGKPFQYAANLTRDVGRRIFRPAKDAWKELADRAQNIKLDPRVAESAYQDLKTGLVNSGDETIFKRMFGTGAEVAPGVIDEGRIGTLMRKAQSGSASLDEMIQVQKDLRAAGSAGNVAANYAATKLNDIMGSYHPEVAKAVRLSALQYRAEEALQSLGAKYTKEKGKFLWDEGQKGKLLHYFDDDNQMAKKAVEELRSIYMDAGKPVKYLDHAETGLKRANVAYKLRSETAQGGNMGRLAAMAPAFITAGFLSPIVGKPIGIAAGAAVGGISAIQNTSPRKFAQMAQLPSRMEAMTNAPMIKFLRDRMNQLTDMGTARMLTGRGFETPQQEQPQPQE
jgi:hypothetical protein